MRVVHVKSIVFNFSDQEFSIAQSKVTLFFPVLLKLGTATIIRN